MILFEFLHQPYVQRLSAGCRIDIVAIILFVSIMFYYVLYNTLVSSISAVATVRVLFYSEGMDGSYV